MAASYFKVPAFVRSAKDKDQQPSREPVLKDADEQFLANITSSKPKTHIPATHIADDGSQKDSDHARRDGIVVLPGKEADQAAKTSPTRPKSALNELPSQEEAEAATKGFQAGALSQTDKTDSKRTWASFIPPIPSISKSSDSEDSRTWAEYAQSYIPALPASWTKSNATAELVYRDDGTVDEEASKAKQEKDVTTLLDKLNLASTNNMVFSISQESQKFYERFVQVLKDVINGAPTAYEDMEKLMHEAGPTIEKQWNSMPPFVQTLVKALPAKLSASFAPELLAAASEKPKLEAKKSDTSSNKKKRSFKIPGLKGLVKKQGLAATMLRNIVVFFETRFPFLLSATNVAMSLSVFVLMFVFYYCWKRGREVRLANEKGEDEDDDADIEVDVTDLEDDEAVTKSQESTEITQAPEKASASTEHS